MIKKISNLIKNCLSIVTIAHKDKSVEYQINKSQQPYILHQFFAASIFFMIIFIYQALKDLMDDVGHSFEYVVDLFGLGIILVGIIILIKTSDDQVHYCENFNLLLSLYMLLSQCLVAYYFEQKEELIFSKDYFISFFRTIYLILQIQVSQEQKYILIITIISLINLGVDQVFNGQYMFSCLILLIQLFLKHSQEKSKRLIIQIDKKIIEMTKVQKIEAIIKEYKSQNQIILFKVQDSSILQNEDFRFLMTPQLGEYNNVNSDHLCNQSEDILEIIYRNHYSKNQFSELKLQEFLKQLFVKNTHGNYENFNLFCINFTCQQNLFNIQIDNATFSKSQIYSASLFPSNIAEGQYSIEIGQCYIFDELYLLVQINHNKIQTHRIFNKSRKSSIEQNVENYRNYQEIFQEQRIVNLAKNISFGMSHEFKTPLNAIQLLCESCVAQIQLKDFNTKQLNNILQDIKHHNKIMFCKVNEFLDMKKIVEGTFDYDRSQFDLHELLEELKSIFIEQFNNKGVQFIIESKLKNYAVYQDRQRLLQILINIVGNALKFTFLGYVKLTVKKLVKKCIFFEIQDSGIGMNEVTIKNLFQLQDGEKNERKQGSGFGLTITKQVLDRIGPNNSIKVQSIQDKGTTIQFQIFRNVFLNQMSKTYFIPSENIQNIKRVKSIIVQNSKSKSQSITLMKQLRILIVDDTSINISALKLLIKLTVKQKLQIAEAYNGLQAVNMCKDNFFDVIFMDINMPIMDGFEAIREIRKIEQKQNRNKSIISIVTAFSPQEMKSSPCDANTILHKPIQRDQILQFFKEFVKIE